MTYFPYLIKPHYAFAPFEALQVLYQAKHLTHSYLDAASCAVANVLARFLPQTRVGVILKKPSLLAAELEERQKLHVFVSTITPSLIIALTTFAARACYYICLPNPVLNGAILGVHTAVTNMFSCGRNAFSHDPDYPIILSQQVASKTLAIRLGIFGFDHPPTEIKNRIKLGVRFLSGLTLLVSSIGLSALRFHPLTTNAIAYSAAAVVAALSKGILYRMTAENSSAKE